MAWKASSAACASPSTCRQTVRTIAPWRARMVSKAASAASSRRCANRSSNSPSVRPTALPGAEEPTEVPPEVTRRCARHDLTSAREPILLILLFPTAGRPNTLFFSSKCAAISPRSSSKVSEPSSTSARGSPRSIWLPRRSHTGHHPLGPSPTICPCRRCAGPCRPLRGLAAPVVRPLCRRLGSSRSLDDGTGRALGPAPGQCHADLPGPAARRGPYLRPLPNDLRPRPPVLQDQLTGPTPKPRCPPCPG